MLKQPTEVESKTIQSVFDEKMTDFLLYRSDHLPNV